MARVNFWSMSSLTGWTNPGWSVVSGWAQAFGNGLGQPVMYRSSGLSTHLGYYECEYYGNGAGDNWGMFSAGWGSATNAYTANGYGYVLRGPSASTPNQLSSLSGIAQYTLPTSPNSEANRVRFGIEVISATNVNVYINRIRVISGATMNDHSANRNIAFGAYNGLTARVRNASVWDAFPGQLTLTNISSQIAPGQIKNVTFTGTAFAGTPVITASGIVVSNVVVASPTQITATIQTDNTVTPGSKSITLTMDDGSVTVYTDGLIVNPTVVINELVGMKIGTSPVLKAMHGSIQVWPKVPVVTGGTTTEYGGYRIHTFTSSGTLGIAGGSLDIEYIVVGGGGSSGAGLTGEGSNFYNAGGGGGGGYKSGSTTLTEGSYSITVGVGATDGSGGSSSIGSTIISNGGGRGSNATGGAGSRGGGGGGGGGGNGSSSTGGAAGSDGQGFAGGNSGLYVRGGGGGGGAGGAGGSTSGTSAGTAGSGITSSISSSAITYSRGGQGGPGGISGVNPGDGGGASGTSIQVGASGIIIVRYLII